MWPFDNGISTENRAQTTLTTFNSSQKISPLHILFIDTVSFFLSFFFFFSVKGIQEMDLHSKTRHATVLLENPGTLYLFSQS